MTTDPTQANCSCTEGFYGHSCDKVWDYCTLYGNETRYDEVSGMSIPVIVARMDCGDHGDCVSENRGYRCDCHRGYDGDYCDIENTPPVVNCTSDYCICPSALLTQHLN
uniref:EGF-like domain-containing protein n=1 Tax=Ciona savignyi TaxID=51511 RepID=H2ZQ75_CIOSA